MRWRPACCWTAGARAASNTGRAAPAARSAPPSPAAKSSFSGGPINAPQLLMLSGVGPAGHLQEHGIEVVHDLPGVGENLQDHLELYIQQACTQPITLYSATGLLGKALIGMRWIAFRSGLGATNHFESGGFIRSRPGVPWPDIQYHFLPMAASYDMQERVRCHGYQAHTGPMRSKSRGTVRLASADPREAPKVRFNYMSHEDDWTDMRACVRLTREIFAQPAFDPYRGDELAPGEAVRSDDEIDGFVRETVQSAYHPQRHLQDGHRRHGGRRSADAGARHGGAARGRQLDHAGHHDGQPQRADHHDRRKGRRRHPRPGPPAAVRRPGLDGAGLGDGAAGERRLDRRRKCRRKDAEAVPPSRTAITGKARMTKREFLLQSQMLPCKLRNPATQRASG